MNQALAIIIAYLLGSFPSAYIATRFILRKDIRKLGGGNIGALNTLKEVGKLTAAAVFIVDVSKGVAAVAVAYWWLGVSPLFIMLAGLAAVIGHMWMIFLKFSGGRGMATTIGALVTILSIYAYWVALGVFLGIVAVPLLTTRNVALAMGLALLFLPLIIWLTTRSILATVIVIVLDLLVGGKFFPTARMAWARAQTKKDFVFPQKPKGKDKKDSG
ncbi:MAG: glycerol-3-phosphate acyltransferase [Chloroflexi bacterium]|nr:glycerol-3-phosphate acyltransferase [Chloroflexota bacterium]